MDIEPLPEDVAGMISGDDVAAKALRTVLRANDVLVRSSDEASLLTATCEVVVSTAGYLLAWVGFGESDEQRSVVCAAKAGEVEYLVDLEVSWSEDDPHGRGPMGTAIRTGKIQVVRDTDTDLNYEPWRERGAQFGIRSTCALPFAHPDGTRGALGIYASEPNAFAGPALALLSDLATNLVYGVANLRHSVHREQMLRAAVTAFSTAIEQRDPYTAGHQRRVSLVVREIADVLHLDEDETRGIVLAAEIHDIGKIGIPIEILTTMALTRLQYEMIQTHSEAGQQIVAGIDFNWPVPRMVREHHERLDGSGYPDGLTAADTLLGSKIIAVADVFESMSSHRPYRQSRGIEVASGELWRGAGICYDREVVMALFEALATDKLGFLRVTGPSVMREGYW